MDKKTVIAQALPDCNDRFLYVEFDKLLFVGFVGWGHDPTDQVAIMKGPVES